MNLLRCLKRCCALSVLLCGLSACESAPEDVDESCTLTSQCPLGFVCNRSAQQCERESADRFLGSFSCVFTKDAVGDVGSTDVVGSVGESTRLALNVAAMCGPGTTEAVYIAVLGQATSGQTQHLQLFISSSAAGSYEVVSPSEFKANPNGRGSGLVDVLDPGASAHRKLADVIGGQVVLDSDAATGTKLSGYLDVTVAAVNP